MVFSVVFLRFLTLVMAALPKTSGFGFSIVIESFVPPSVVVRYFIVLNVIVPISKVCLRVTFF